LHPQFAALCREPLQGRNQGNPFAAVLSFEQYAEPRIFLRTFQNQVRAQVEKTDSALAQRLNAGAE